MRGERTYTSPARRPPDVGGGGPGGPSRSLPVAALTDGRARARARRAAIIAPMLIAASGLGGCAVPNTADRSVFRPERSAVLVELRPEDRNAFEDGVALAAELKYPEAERKFANVLGWYQAAGDTERASETMFWLAFCQEKQGRYEEARTGYAKLAKEYPKSAAAGRAAARLSRLPVPKPPKAPKPTKGAPPGRPDEPKVPAAPVPSRAGRPAAGPAAPTSAPARPDTPAARK